VETPVVASLSGERLSLADRLNGLNPGVGSQRIRAPKPSDELSPRLQNTHILVMSFASLSLLESSELLCERLELF
jgi:hypothetical protein